MNDIDYTGENNRWFFKSRADSEQKHYSKTGGDFSFSFELNFGNYSVLKLFTAFLSNCENSFFCLPI